MNNRIRAYVIISYTVFMLLALPIAHELIHVMQNSEHNILNICYVGWNIKSNSTAWVQFDGGGEFYMNNMDAMENEAYFWGYMALIPMAVGFFILVGWLEFEPKRTSRTNT